MALTPEQDGHVPEIVTASLQELFGKPEWPPTYPHVPGRPCPDCGWNGETNAD